VGSLVVAHEIRIAIGTSELEVPILRRQPRVEHLRDVDTTVANDQRSRRLLAAVASVALDVNGVVSCSRIRSPRSSLAATQRSQSSVSVFPHVRRALDAIHSLTSSSRQATTLTETLTRLGKLPLRSMRQIVDRESPVRCRTSAKRRSLRETVDDAMRPFVSSTSAALTSDPSLRAVPFDLMAAVLS
jgi:hypothetical protein